MLRHRPGPFSDEGVDRTDDKLMPLPRYAKPAECHFLRDGVMDEVVRCVKQNPYIQVNAGVGAGKSTRLPYLLAEKLDTLVVHTIPFGIAAHMCYKYASTLHKDVHYIDDLDAEFPTKGVVITTNMYMLMRWFTNRLGKPPNFILYMDENHEGDCWTAVLRKMAKNWSCVSKLVLATATANPGSDLGVRLPSPRVDNEYEYEKSSQWSVYDSDKPWSAHNIDGNACLCIDRPEARLSLANQYRESGFIVHMLDRTSRPDEAEAAFAALSKNDGYSNVLIVDYSWRSSLTIPGVSLAIDSGEVSYSQLDNEGIPRLMVRRAFHGEQHQFINRFGRLENNRVVTWRPRHAKKNICDVEAVEIEAAALMFRMLGFCPPLEYRSAKMFRGPVPINLVATLQGDTPIGALRDEHLVPWVRSGAKPWVEVEKDIKPFNYSLPEPLEYKPARCQTVIEKSSVHGRTLSAGSSILELDPEEYRSAIDSLMSRPSSRQSVHTLRSDEPNNVSIFRDPDNPVYEKPKRIAKRVLEQRRSQELLQQQQQQADQPSLSATVDTVDATLSNAVTRASLNDQTVASGTRRGGTALDAVPLSPVEELVFRHNSTGVRAAKDAISDEQVGKYMYYEGMASAPPRTLTFHRGYDSVLDFVRGADFESRVRVMAERDKMFAIKQLTDKYNDSTAKRKAIDRLMVALSARVEEISQFVDESAFVTVAGRMVETRRDIGFDIDACRMALVKFITYPMQEGPELVALEQHYMENYMNEVETAAVKKDPDKCRAYFEDFGRRELQPGIAQADRNLLR